MVDARNATGPVDRSSVVGMNARRPPTEEGEIRALSGRAHGPRTIDSAIPRWYHSGMAMTLRLTDTDEKILADLAEQEGISRQEATVRAIREAAARRGHQQAVQALSVRGRERYADLLDRLGR